MWTLKTERKIPTRTAGPPSSSSCSMVVMSETVPSAGLTIRCVFGRHRPLGVAEEGEQPDQHQHHADDQEPQRPQRRILQQRRRDGHQHHRPDQHFLEAVPSYAKHPGQPTPRAEGCQRDDRSNAVGHRVFQFAF